MTKSVCGVVACALVFGTVCGCAYHSRMRTGEPGDPSKTVTITKDLYGWGCAESDPTDIETLCPGGVAECGSYVSLTDWLCAVSTGGIYTPLTVYAVPAIRD